eukprot:TRINITY_DN18826_c0_g1_i1.p1 TRINITY_DN18826_c0_g1~~TRINITY_DN18826_c0_g1_i1.p1  ORF type:complete len:252 (-),score=70.70 TRINITY_DN18826_c0_g1_i1:169-924(-)
MVLSESHSVLLQSLRVRGPRSEAALKRMYCTLTRSANDGGFPSFIREINEAIGQMGMEVRAGAMQETGEVVLSLVNKVMDNISISFGSTFTRAQIDYFCAIVESIAHDEEASGRISSAQALNLDFKPEEDANPSQSGPQSQAEGGQAALSLSERERTIEELVAQQWLVNLEDGGSVGIGAQTYLELKSWLKELVDACEICNEAAIKARCCPNLNCTYRLHEWCAARKFHSRARDDCPKCRTRWTQTNLSSS